MANSTEEIQDLLAQWETETDMDARDKLYKELQERRLFPATTDAWEAEAGLYPGTDDPRFVEKLMLKQEFAENFQESFGTQQKRGVNPCDSQEEFELTPTQRFVSRFMSPQCPYTSALLFHGVGVGKTCAAITTAEAYLRAYPRSPVFIIAPRTIQSGFRRTIYDDDAMVLGKEDEPNQLRGCTGADYLRRTGSEFERERGVISRRVTMAINSRYRIMGYIQFYRYIADILERVPKSLPRERREQEEMKLLRREFSGRLVIIDEAHNLRDAPGETEDDNTDAAGGETELSEAKAGKRLTPLLIRVLAAADDMKLMLLTGTPMYNSYREIIFLLNLLLLNDKKATLSEKDIFLPTGRFRPGGEERLGAVASAYLSFMRGENPLSFPVRLPPGEEVPRLDAWPTESPTGEPIPGDSDTVTGLLRLPLVPVSFEGESLKEVRAMADTIVDAGGLGVKSIDEMVQTGNWYFPGDDPESRIRDAGFNGVFEEGEGKGLAQLRSKGDAGWLATERLAAASPKAAFVLRRITTTRGPVFLYSRFIRSGALPLAIALEANGYTAWGRDKPLFANGVVDGQGRQCALCEARERVHRGKAHPFTPAQYVLLTGQAAYSPNNAAAIAAARSAANKKGAVVKVVIGSQVASEGIDLRFIREIYMFDSWFHLNKMEQVLGRGVRTCSHSLLDPVERNCTIYLLVNSYGPGEAETADMYMYRTAMAKALQMGRVTRALKRYALDCNLNYRAVLAMDLDPLERQEDSQGVVRENIPLNDTPYTAICDWTTCEYSCAKPVAIERAVREGRIDMSTYDEYAIRWREVQLKKILKNIFEEGETPMIQIDSLIEILQTAGIPEAAIRGLLADVVGKTSFRLRVKGQEGYIVYRNTFYLFQPIRLADVRIPLALRIADVPVRRDVFEPAAAAVRIVEEAVAAAEPEVEGEAVAEKAPAPAAKAPTATATAEKLWTAIASWADTIEAGTAEMDIPIPVLEALEARYRDDEYKRAFNLLVMISWMVEDIQRGDYTEEQRATFRPVLAQVLGELVWDDAFSATEQLELVRAGGARTTDSAREQLLKRGDTQIFRHVVPTTGSIEYLCPGADGGYSKCSEAVVRVLEGSATDPLQGIQANRNTTGRIYGMILPKLKDGKLVFKTNNRPVDPGVQPEKGGECEIVSSISNHKKELKEIRDMIVGLGYPEFLLRDEVLEEKAGRPTSLAAKKKKGAKEEEVSPRRAEFLKTQTKLRLDARKFQNVVKACALKNIILRMVDILESRRGGAGASRRYFFRPVAAIKARHKLK